MLFRSHGVAVDLPEDADPFVQLFSESAGRVLVSLPAAEADALATLCAEHDVPLHALGRVTGTDDAAVAVTGQFSLPLEQIRSTWSATLPGVLAADPVSVVAGA